MLKTAPVVVGNINPKMKELYDQLQAIDPITKAKRFENLQLNYDGQNGAERTLAAMKKVARKSSDPVNKCFVNNRIILIGYSAGGDAVTLVANRLTQPEFADVKIDLAFTIDPVPVRRDLVTQNAILTLPEFGPIDRSSVKRWVNVLEKLDQKSLFLGAISVQGRSIKGADYELNITESQLRSRLHPRLVPAQISKYAHIFIPDADVVRDLLYAEMGKISDVPEIKESSPRNGKP